MHPKFVFRVISFFSPFVGFSVLLVLTTASSASTPFQPVFLTTPTYTASGSTVAVADVNGDGIPDVITGSPFTSVQVLLGNGDGTFRAALNHPSGGTGVYSVAVADLNRDGKPDIIFLTATNCVNYGEGPVCQYPVNVLFGNGDGTFQPPVTAYTPQIASLNFDVGDVNGDGIPDLVFYNAVVLGNGNGTFQSPILHSSVGSTFVLGDVNGDGKPDLVGVGYQGYLFNVALGNGDGTFQTPVNYSSPYGGGASSLALGDLNGDGKLDLVLGDEEINSICLGGCVSVLLGKGDGTFQPQVNYAAGYFAEAVAIGDVTGDGKPDVIVGSTGPVAVLPGNGNGTFQSPLLYNSSGNTVNALAVADLNGDGVADVVAGMAGISNGPLTPPNDLAVLLASGNGTLRSASLYAPPTVAVGGVAVADLRNNGKEDLIETIACSAVYLCALANPLEALLGNGDGTFQSVANISAGAGTAPYFVAAADVNGDGKADVLVTNRFACASCNTGSVNVLLGNGDGRFQTPVEYAAGGYGTEQVAVADVNGDGKPDLVALNQYLCSTVACPDGAVGVLLGDGDGTFQPVVSYDTGAPDASSVAIADLNGDGKPDLVVTNYGIDFSKPGVLGVLLNKGDGTYYPPVTYASGGTDPYAVAVGDVNGDGKPDLVVAHSCVGVNNCANTSVAVLLGVGDGTFMAPVSIPMPQLTAFGGHSYTGAGNMVLADFNHSGILDIVAGGEFLLLGNGNGTFQPPILLGPSGPSTAVGDVNGDGKPDLVVGGGTILLNITPDYTTTTTLSSSLNTAVAGQPVSFTATVTPSGNAGAFTGRVTFFDGGAGLGSVFLKNGRATFTSSKLAPGMHSITAVYGADTNYQFQGSTSSVLNETIQPAVVTLAGSPQQPLTTDGRGDFVAQVTITNTGNVTVSSVRVTSATLGSGALLSAPAAIANLAPGASAVVTLTFPANSVLSGATTAPLKLGGTYSVTSPALGGNWALSFRRVTL